MTILTGRAVQRLTLIAACLGQVMMVLDVLIVSVALPSMQPELRLSAWSGSSARTPWFSRR